MINLILLRDSCLLLLYILTSVLALIGNGLVCRICIQRKNSNNLPLSTPSIFLLNLALADALSGLTVLLQLIFCSKYFLENVLFSSHLCLLNKCLQILSYNTSTLTICIIAFDRYRIIQDPLQRHYHRRARLSLFITWIFCGLFALTCFFSMRVPIYFSSYEKLISCRILFPNLSTNFLRRIRMFCSLIMFYCIPMIILSILCTLTMHTIARRSIIGARQFSQFKKTKIRSIRLLIIIVIIFALSHLPVQLINLHTFFTRPVTSNRCNDTTTYLFFYWLSISSCCHNPIIYSWFNRQFRTLVLNCFRSMISCGRQ